MDLSQRYKLAAKGSSLGIRVSLFLCNWMGVFVRLFTQRLTWADRFSVKV